LYSLEGDEIYIGSTINSLAERLSIHKYHHKHELSCKSKILFEKYKEVKIELIEDFPCNSKKELERREGELQIINIEIIVNKRIEGRTYKEWYEANKEKKCIYYEANIEKITEQKRIYYEANIEKITEQKRIYREANKEKEREQKRIYRAKKKALKNTISISQ
jgi:hypothetical protein